MNEPKKEIVDSEFENLLAEGKKNRETANKTVSGRVNPLNVKSTVTGLHHEGYTPQMLAAAGAAGFAYKFQKNYRKNLEAVKAAIKAEEKLLKDIKEPATKGGKQPFAKDGFTMTGQADRKATKPTRNVTARPAVREVRQGNVKAVGGPQGTGLGVLKGKESDVALRMTGEQMFRYLYPQSGEGATATTPRVEVQGLYPEGDPRAKGHSGRHRVVITPESLASGKLPSPALPSGQMPAPAEPWYQPSRWLRGIGNLSEQGINKAAPYLQSIIDNPAYQKAAGVASRVAQGAGLVGYGNQLYQSGPTAIIEYGLPYFSRFAGLGPAPELGRGSEITDRGRYVYGPDGARFVSNEEMAIEEERQLMEYLSNPNRWGDENNFYSSPMPK